MSPASFRGIVLESARVRLRGLAERDLGHTLAWRNDERSLRWFKSQEKLLPQAHAAWFGRYAASDYPDCMFFAETLQGQPVGQSSIYNFRSDRTVAEVGRFLSDPDLRGKGLFREALMLTLDIAFGPVGLEGVHLEVFEENDRAIRLYQSMGFSESGRSHGMLLMELLGKDYLGRNLARATGEGAWKGFGG